MMREGLVKVRHTELTTMNSALPALGCPDGWTFREAEMRGCSIADC